MTLLGKPIDLAAAGYRHLDLCHNDTQHLTQNTPNTKNINVGKITAFEVMVQPSLSLNLVTDGEKVTKSATKSTETMNEVLAFCERPKSLTEIMAHLGLKHRNNAKSRYIDPLIENGFLEMTIPEKPNSRNQKYVRALS